jgi:hypothetical protein
MNAIEFISLAVMGTSLLVIAINVVLSEVVK